MSKHQIIFSKSNKIKELQKFERYEFKYLLRKQLSDAIEEEVRHFMAYDGYVHPELGNRYFVRSLYFDNWIASNFYEKVDGLKRRNKYRIRTYSQEEDCDVPLFLEKKGRVNERTYKLRTSIENEHLNYFLHSGYDFFELPRFRTLTTKPPRPQRFLYCSYLFFPVRFKLIRCIPYFFHNLSPIL
jgi:hypothetical protein